MNIAQIEENLQKLVKSFKKESFIYDILLAYGKTNVTIKRLQGSLNLSKVEGEILWKKNLFYKIETKQNIHVLLEEIKADPKATKNSPRFLILTVLARLYMQVHKQAGRAQSRYHKTGNSYYIIIMQGQYYFFINVKKVPYGISLAFCRGNCKANIL